LDKIIKDTNEMIYPLTNSQQKVFDLVENTSYNYLIVGKPGVGKSVLINALVELGKKVYTLAAPTGLAALNINGRTLHSIFRIPTSGVIPPDYDNYTNDEKTVNYIRFSVKTLIIDEVSMVSADTLDYIDRVLRAIKGVPAPFGGIQVIMVGDFFQLPPVTDPKAKHDLALYHYNSEFVFDAHCFAGNFKILQLDEVLRQKGDTAFIELLNAARVGKVGATQIKALNARVLPLQPLIIVLTGTNKQADEINYGKLRSIQGEATTFTGLKWGEWKALPAEESLNLKVGAQVMIKVNKADRPPRLAGPFESDVVNGTIGVVTKIVDQPEDEEAVEFDKYVEVELKDGKRVNIYERRWERKIKSRNSDTGKWEEKLVATYEQMPLALSWAISIHKSQGQTFELAHIDPSRIFAAGQLYVALSRCKTMAGITLESAINSRMFFANMDVLMFFQQLEEQTYEQT
jgi:ATP-dependent DNA helicase PIF1